MKVLEFEVNVLMQVKSVHLDVPRSSYEILNPMEFCRCVGYHFYSNFELNSVLNGAELGDLIYMKVIDLCLIFPNNFSLLNLEAYSSSYEFLGKENLN